jgi:hypothetical protein
MEIYALKAKLDDNNTEILSYHKKKENAQKLADRINSKDEKLATVYNYDFISNVYVVLITVNK